MSTRTTYRRKAAELAEHGLNYVGPGPCPSSTWAYDSIGRAVVLDKDGSEIDRTAAGARARTVARASELTTTMRIPGYRVRYATTGERAVGFEAPLPEHLHACRDRNGRLSDNLGDEIHPDGACRTWVPFDPAAAVTISHVLPSPERPLVIVNAPEVTAPPHPAQPVPATYAGTCGMCWGSYPAGAQIVLAHQHSAGPAHAQCVTTHDLTQPEPSGTTRTQLQI